MQKLGGPLIFWTSSSWDPSPRPFSSLHRHCLLALFSSRGAGRLGKDTSLSISQGQLTIPESRVIEPPKAVLCLTPFLCYDDLEFATMIAGMAQGSEIADSTEDCGLWT